MLVPSAMARIAAHCCAYEFTAVVFEEALALLFAVGLGLLGAEVAVAAAAGEGAGGIRRGLVGLYCAGVSLPVGAVVGLDCAAVAVVGLAGVGGSR